MIDLFTAPQLRDAGIDQVSKNSPTWLEKAMKLIASYPHKEATGEDLREYVEARIGQPHHHNVYGAMVMKAARGGLITKTGEYRPMKRKESHARVNPVYKLNPAQ